MNLLKSISVYGFFTLVEKSIGFILLPIFTFYLTTKDYGILANYQIVLSILALVILSGSHAAFNIEFIKREYSSFKVFMSSLFSNILFSTCLITIFTIIFSESLVAFFEIPFFWVYFLPVLACFSAFSTILMNYLQISKNAMSYGIFSTIRLVINLCISLFLIVCLNYDYSGRLWAGVGSSFISVIFAIYFFYKKQLLTFRINIKYMKNILLFGLPLLPNGLSHLVINSSDRLFITKMVSLEETGIYQVGYTLGSLVLIYALIFFKAWTPILYELLKKNDFPSKIKIVRISTLYVISVIILVFMISYILAPIVFNYFVDVAFIDGQKYVLGVSFSYFFWALFQIFGQILFFNKKTNLFFVVGLLNISLNIALNYFLIKIYGTMGAVYATIIGLSVFCLIVSLYSHNLFPLPWQQGIKTLIFKPNE